MTDRERVTDRERAKEALLKAMGNSYLNLDAMLDAVILVVDPIIRADERQHTPYSRTAAGVRAYAEAVAAQLVEVICEQDREWAGTEWRAMRRERDAARARVTELANEVIDLRAEVAALRDQLDIAIDERHHADMRAALRLRAKVEGLGHWIDCEAFENLNEGSDYGNENIRETGEPCSCLIGEFLALLDEEVDRG